MALRRIGRRVIVDTREFYVFNLPGGRKVETKADSMEEAVKRICDTLELDKKDLVYDKMYS